MGTAQWVTLHTDTSAHPDQIWVVSSQSQRQPSTCTPHQGMLDLRPVEAIKGWAGQKPEGVWVHSHILPGGQIRWDQKGIDNLPSSPVAAALALLRARVRLMGGVCAAERPRAVAWAGGAEREALSVAADWEAA